MEKFEIIDSKPLKIENQTITKIPYIPKRYSQSKRGKKQSNEEESSPTILKRSSFSEQQIRPYTEKRPRSPSKFILKEVKIIKKNGNMPNEKYERNNSHEKLPLINLRDIPTVSSDFPE